MILRRVAEHIRVQNWTAVAIELVIVVLGVFIGIQVSNWNAARLDTMDAVSYRERLVDDMLAERQALDERIAYYEATRTHGVAALAELEAGSAEPTSRLLVDAYQATQEWQFNAVGPTYDEMISAGRLDLLPDPTLRNRLVIYYGELDEYRTSWEQLTQYRERTRSILPIALQERIHDTCETVFVDDRGASLVARTGGRCDVTMSDAEIARGFAALTAAPDLPVLLTRHLSVVDEKLRAYRDRRLQTDAMLAHLRGTR